MASPESGSRPGETAEQGMLLPKELSREELITRANKVLLLFAERATLPLHDEVRQGRGRQAILATQEGRPGEELIGIDQPAENILKGAIREAQLPAILISEGTPEPTQFGNGASEKFFIYSDPFDNSSPYKRGLDIPPYTVCSIWDKDGEPIGAVVGDIKDRKAYVSMNGENFVWDLETKMVEKQNFTERENNLLTDQAKLFEGTIQTTDEHSMQLRQFTESEKQQLIELKRRIQKNRDDFSEFLKKEPEMTKIKKSERTTLKDRDATLASFKAENQYSIKFNTYFANLVRDMHPKGYVYDGGGAFAYGRLLATGAADAYVMFDEPLSEIIPGLPFAITADCTVVSVNLEDGAFKEFKFSPNDLKENYKLYSEGTVPLFIAAATPEIRDEIIRYYMEAKKAIEAETQLHQEGEIFRDPQAQPPTN